jgi:hypothetical protein
MPQFCPKCGNMVGDGIERCPACGSRMQPRVMDERSGFTWADFFNYSFFTVLFLVLVIAIPTITALFCLHLVLR